MKKLQNYQTFTFLLLLVILVAGCGSSATGPIKQAIPDFYAPAIAGATYTPNPAVSGQDLKISVTSTDNSGSPTVKLDYRSIGATGFTTLTPTNAVSNIYSFTIPGAAVVTPGVEYYITSSDGENTTQDPAGAPTTTYQIPINFVTIVHNPVTSVKALAETFISATLTSDTAIDQTQSGFRYRVVGAANFTEVLFGTKNGDIYTGSIPTNTLLDGSSYEYYIFSRSAGGATSTYPTTAGTYLTFLSSSSVNNKPVAQPQVVTDSDLLTVGAEIQLDGGYADSDGPGPYSFKWTKATGNPLELSVYDSRVTTFTAISPGTYTFELIVSDGQDTSEKVPINITVAAPTLSGNITQDTILRTASSPYTVISDVVIATGTTLKIERGVEVKFKSDTGMTVLGNLQADGDTDNPIKFTSDSTLPIKGFWKGLYVGSTAATTPTLPQSTISFCTIQYSKDGLVIRNANSPTISNCTIQQNENQGILAEDTTITIHKCNILSNGNYGVIARSNTGTPLTYATLSSNVIEKNLIAGIYCENSRVELAKNEISENKFGVQIVRCQGANVVNVVGNKIHDNADGLRIEDSDALIGGNQIYLNKDNGITAFTNNNQGGTYYTSLTIVSNAIHNNFDDGIQLENCYPVGPRSYATDDGSNFIYSNVISFNGAEGIELIGSSPVIERNIIGLSSDNGILCIQSVAPLSRASSPLLLNNVFLANSRAALACIGDQVNGGVNRPEAWWNSFYVNTMNWIDIQADPRTDISSQMDATGTYNRMDVGWSPQAGTITAHASDTGGTWVVTDNSYATGGRSYYLYDGTAHPFAGVAGLPGRFGWNLRNIGPGFNTSADVNGMPWEEPFSDNWALLSDDSNPRNSVNPHPFVNFVKNAAYTSPLISSGEPINPGLINAGMIPYSGANVSNPAVFSTVPSPTTPVPAGYAVVSLADPNVVGATAVNFVTRNGNYQISGLGYVNYLNSNITLNTWIFGKWPTK